jgi:N12 class adenine-specific DNA methylase
MEMRRLGIARKPFIAVPNHLTLQWRSEFNRLYPGSNILAATPDDFSKGNREKFFSKIITGDWDAVIVGHSSLKKLLCLLKQKRQFWKNKLMKSPPQLKKSSVTVVIETLFVTWKISVHDYKTV